MTTSAFSLLAFFVVLFDWRQQARWRAQRLAVIEERQVADVKRQRASGRFFLEDDGDRAAFHAFAEPDATSAGKTRVSEAFQHPAGDCTTGAI